MSLQITHTRLPGLPGAVEEIDVGPHGAWVAACGGPTGTMIVTERTQFASPSHQLHPFVRLLGNGDVLVIASRTRREPENAWIVSSTGELKARFAVGDGVADVLVVDGRIVCTYFDEGILPCGPFAVDGVSVFDLSGRQTLGYHADVDGAVEITDCYCVVHSAPDEICFSAYIDFALVRLNIQTGVQRIHELPEQLHGCSALSVSGDEFFLYGPYGAKQGLFRWAPGAAPVRVGAHGGVLRGRDGGKFLTTERDGYAIVSVWQEDAGC